MFILLILLFRIFLAKILQLRQTKNKSEDPYYDQPEYESHQIGSEFLMLKLLSYLFDNDCDKTLTLFREK